MRDTSDPTDSNTPNPDASSRWNAPPTAKERGAVQRTVDRLLDELAPDRATGRATRPPEAVERHRTPRGCILQAAAAAVTVSWFPDAADDAALGELQIVAWRGTVSRPGSATRVGGATVAHERVLRPVESAPAVWAWRGDDGAVQTSEALAADCVALLERQSAAEAAS